jgi:DNA repair exonuclease SbcCD ATPase subunit
MDDATSGDHGVLQGSGSDTGWAGNEEDIAKKAEEAFNQFTGAKARRKKEEEELTKSRKHVRRCEKAQQIVQLVAEDAQNKAHARIANLVTRCLEAVFDDPYQFVINFERKRGKTDAVLTFVRDDVMLEDPSDEAGGGVLDVAAFALRLACLVMQRPRRRLLLILDEPFKFVSEEYRERVRDLLLALSQEMNVQFILVTHIPELKIGKVIEI